MKHIFSAFFAAFFLLFGSPNAGHVDSVTLNKTTLTLSPGQSETLVATLKPDGVRALVTWASSDESVVTVDSPPGAISATGATSISPSAAEVYSLLTGRLSPTISGGHTSVTSASLSAL